MKKAKPLSEKWTTEIFPKPPLNFDPTVYKPDHFPVPSHIWKKGKYWQTMRLDGKIMGFKMEDKGTIKKPRIKLSLFAKKPLTSKEKKRAFEKINSQFDLKEDLTEFYTKFRGDKILGSAIERLLGMRPSGGEVGLYPMLMVFIVLQNATVRRTVQMMNALLERYGTKVGFNGKEMYAFWTPKVLNKASEEELRSLKVGYRARFLKKISESFVKGEIDEEKLKKLPQEEVKKELLKLYGIGPASVAYFLGYDYLEVIPPWEQKIYSRILYDKKLVPAGRILKDVERWWGKWKGLALHYLWEDLFWRHQTKPIDWLEKEIRR